MFPVAVRVVTRPPEGSRLHEQSEGGARSRVVLLRRQGPALALAGLVVVAAAGYGAAAQLVDMPLVNPDELRYTLAARALADGGWFDLREHAYGYGVVYPAVLAPFIDLKGSVEAAYPLFKLANAVLFALSAVPVYFLARRLLSGWWSVGVAAVSVAIPSSLYTSLVLTESVSYLTFSVAVLSVVLALERPSVRRQVVMLGAVGLAYATRAEFAALLAAFLVGIVLVALIDPTRPGAGEAALGTWPTLVTVGAGLGAVAARPVLTWSSPRGALGGYEDLWRGYDPASVARFFVYHLAEWELYLFVVPFVVAPVVLARLLRASRQGAARDGAFSAAFLTVNGVLFVVAAAFASTPYGYSELHDRYFFYVAPLWLVAFGAWLSAGMPRPVRSTATGVALALVLPAILPFGLIGGNVVFEAVPTAFWSWLWTVIGSTPHMDGKRAVAILVVALTAATVTVPRRVWPLLPGLVVVGLLVTSVLAWKRQVDEPEAFVHADRGSRTWVDAAVPAGARVLKIYVSPLDCPNTEMTRQALFLTEFFNDSVDRAVEIGDSVPDGLPIDQVDVAPAGQLVFPGGRPLVARYVLAQTELHIAGRQLAHGSGAGLTLWRTSGGVRLVNEARGPNDVIDDVCGYGPDGRAGYRPRIQPPTSSSALAPEVGRVRR